MALAAKRRVVVNAGRRTKSNRRRRNMSAKQIKFFGTPAQKAGLRRRKNISLPRGWGARASRREARLRTSYSRALRYGKRRAKQLSLGLGRTKGRAINSARVRPRKSRARQNPGDILSLVLNPGGRKGKQMAAPRRRRRSNKSASGRRYHRRRRSVANPHHRRRRRMVANPAHRRRRNRRNYTHHRRRRNPGGGGEGSFKNAITQGLSFMGGYFGSKFVTQAIMGTNNTSTMGYLGNAAATAALAIMAHVFPPTRKYSMAIVAGGATQILARVLSDNTAFGQLTSSLGVGDYQAQNFVTPQRLVDPLNSAQIEIPAGWGAPAPVVVSTASAPGANPTGMPAHPGMGGYNSQGMGRGMYSSAGLYS